MNTSDDLIKGDQSDNPSLRPVRRGRTPVLMQVADLRSAESAERAQVGRKDSMVTPTPLTMDKLTQSPSQLIGRAVISSKALLFGMFLTMASIRWRPWTYRVGGGFATVVLVVVILQIISGGDQSVPVEDVDLWADQQVALKKVEKVETAPVEPETEIQIVSNAGNALAERIEKPQVNPPPIGQELAETSNSKVKVHEISEVANWKPTIGAETDTGPPAAPSLSSIPTLAVDDDERQDDALSRGFVTESVRRPWAEYTNSTSMEETTPQRRMAISSMSNSRSRNTDRPYSRETPQNTSSLQSNGGHRESVALAPNNHGHERPWSDRPLSGRSQVPNYNGASYPTTNAPELDFRSFSDSRGIASSTLRDRHEYRIAQRPFDSRYETAPNPRDGGAVRPPPPQHGSPRGGGAQLNGRIERYETRRDYEQYQ